MLVPLVERPEGLCLLYEVRADTLGRQPGEVCFPGGKMEGAESPESCALRETWRSYPSPKITSACWGGWILSPTGPTSSSIPSWGWWTGRDWSA